jgi:hypothetical protein
MQANSGKLMLSKSKLQKNVKEKQKVQVLKTKVAGKYLKR